MDHRQRHRGRPRVIIGDSVAASSMLPLQTYDHWAKAALHSNQSLSAIIRNTLQAAKDAFDIVPLLNQMKADRDEALQRELEGLQREGEGLQREEHLLLIIVRLSETIRTLTSDPDLAVNITLGELSAAFDFPKLLARRSEDA